MNIKQKIAFSATTFLILTVFGLLFGLKIYFTLTFPEKELKAIIVEMFSKNLNKAVKFDSISISSFGNIELKNFVLSSSNDFNDNLNFVESEKAIFRQNFFKLLNRKISLKEIILTDSQITVRKPSGKSHSFAIKQITDLIKPINSIDFVDKKEFTITLDNTTIHYYETLPHNTIHISIRSISGNLSIIKNVLTYNISGLIDNKYSTNLKTGEFHLFTQQTDTKSQSVNILKFRNFDLSYFNDFLQSYDISDKLFTGGISAKIAITDMNNKYTLKGFCQTNNLHVIANNKNRFNIISNENLDLTFNIQSDHEFKSIDIKRLKLLDDNIKIKLHGSYVHKDDRKKYFIKFQSNTIDLSKLSHYFTPVNNITYSGKLKCGGIIDYDSSQKNNSRSDCNITLVNSSLFHHGNKEKIRIITDGQILLSLYNNILRSSISFKTDKSDYTIKTSTDIHSISPLQSDSVLSVHSDTASFKELLLPVKLLVHKCYTEAYQDLKKGYEEIFFLQKPLAGYLNNNNIILSVEAEKIIAGTNAQFNDCSFNINLSRGIIRLQNFEWNGYNGKYELELHGYFNRDYPLLKASGSINNFDIEHFSKDYGLSGTIQGNGNANFEYELTAYRISHLLTNARGSYTIQFLKPALFNTVLQKKIENYLQENGYTGVNLKHIESNYLSIFITQYSDTYHIRNLGISMPDVQFSSHGTYTYKDGLDFTIYARLKGDDTIYNVPLFFHGPMTAPCFKIKKDIVTQQSCLQ